MSDIVGVKLSPIEQKEKKMVEVRNYFLYRYPITRPYTTHMKNPTHTNIVVIIGNPIL